MVGMGVMATLEEVIMDSTMAALMAVRARETRGGYGSGTGEDIGEFMMSSWTLSPGAGGKFYEEIFGDNHYGGGGGGVTVYGEGPYASEYQGQGYGGGGSGYSYTNGLQGVVLLETESG